MANEVRLAVLCRLIEGDKSVFYRISNAGAMALLETLYRQFCQNPARCQPD
jgi:hypothetical protein